MKWVPLDKKYNYVQTGREITPSTVATMFLILATNPWHISFRKVVILYLEVAPILTNYNNSFII